MNMNTKTKLVLTCLCVTVAVARGQSSTNVTVNTAIPNDYNGLVSSVTLSGLSAAVSDVTVSLDITGANGYYNSDIYAYLQAPNGGLAVLLNRVGVSSSNTNGYSDTRFDVTLSDSAVNGSIHNYQNVTGPGIGTLTGTWQPDGENIDPASSPSAFTGVQTAMLSNLTGADGSGQWSLFVTDTSVGGQATLVSWVINVSTVPEPKAGMLVIGGGLALFLGQRRLRAKQVP